MEVSVPLMGVRQALMALFDEARLRSEAILRGVQAKQAARQKRKQQLASEANGQGKSSG